MKNKRKWFPLNGKIAYTNRNSEKMKKMVTLDRKMVPNSSNRQKRGFLLDKKGFPLAGIDKKRKKLVITR